MDKGLIRALVIAGAAEHEAAAQNEELMVILNSLDQALKDLNPAHPAWPWLVEAEKATYRLGLITRRMLQYRKRFRLDRMSASA